MSVIAENLSGKGEILCRLILFSVWFLCLNCSRKQLKKKKERKKEKILIEFYPSVSSVAQSCLTLCIPMNYRTPGLPVHHQLPEFAQTHVHWVSDAIQPSHPLSSPSPPALSLSQHQGLFQWVSSSHQVAKLLEFQLQPQFFEWTPGTDLL